MPKEELMRQVKAPVAVVVTAILAVAACESPPTKQDVGGVSGAVIGGVVGSTIGGGTGRTVAIVAGTLAGAMLGSHIGKRMDEADRMKAAQALENAPTGQQTTWRNPGQRCAVHGRSHAHLRSRRHPLPRLHGERDGRRQARDGEGQGVPPGGRHLANHGRLVTSSSREPALSGQRSQGLSAPQGSSRSRPLRCRSPGSGRPSSRA